MICGRGIGGGVDRGEAAPRRQESWRRVELAAAGGRILVVDDDEDSRIALRALLESYGYSVVEAGDGLEAVTVATRARPDLILMDLMMPVMDGLEATRRIRAIPALDGVRIVCLSAMEGAREASRNAGFDECIVKPLNLTRFRQRVAAWLDGC